MQTNDEPVMGTCSACAFSYAENGKTLCDLFHRETSRRTMMCPQGEEPTPAFEIAGTRDISEVFEKRYHGCAVHSLDHGE